MARKTLKRFHFIARIFNRKGSAALMMSLVVSSGVLSTVYITQKMAGNFFSSLSQSVEEWDKHLVAQSVQALAGYLVSNNLILCRSAGWQGKQSKCIWSTAEDTDDPSDFYLSHEKDSNAGLSFSGTYTVDGEPKKFNLTFNLVNWQSSPIEKLIGKIPEYVCRKKSDLSIIPSGTCPDYKPSSVEVGKQACKNTGNINPTDSWCEYIAPADGDTWIVLVKVEVPFKDPVSKTEKTHTVLSGIRRPLALVALQSIISGKRCSQSCNFGKSAHFAPDCRDNPAPAEDGVYTGMASKVISVKNAGPGAVYKLSLVKHTIDISDPDKGPKTDVTPDIISSAKKEVLLPGDILSFESFYKCPVVVKLERVYRKGTRESVSHSVRNQIVAFQEVAYSFSLDAQNPVGACYTIEGEPLKGTVPDVSATLPSNRKLISPSDPDLKLCKDGASSCSHGGENGSCIYSDIEPRRLFLSPHPPIKSGIQGQVKTLRTTIVTPPPPSRPPPNSGDGGDGDGDGDGGGN